MAGSTGLEPAASGVTGRRSNQLNYDPDQVQSSKSKVKSTLPTCRLTLNLTLYTSNLRSVWWAVQDSNL